MIGQQQTFRPEFQQFNQGPREEFHDQFSHVPEGENLFGPSNSSFRSPEPAFRPRPSRPPTPTFPAHIASTPDFPTSFINEDNFDGNFDEFQFNPRPQRPQNDFPPPRPTFNTFNEFPTTDAQLKPGDNLFGPIKEFHFGTDLGQDRVTPFSVETERPFRPRPSRPHTTQSFNRPNFGSSFSSNKAECLKYTDDICLEVNDYPM